MGYEASRQVENGDRRVILEETTASVIPRGARTMVATTSIDALEWIRKQVDSAPDALREALTQMVNLDLDE